MRRVVVAAATAALLAGCGGGSSDLSVRAEGLLKADVARIAQAARAGNGSAVRAAVAELRRDVAAQRRTGGLSAARADRVLAAAAAVVGDVPVPVPTVSPTPSPTRSPAAKPAPAPRHAEHKKKGKEHGD